MEVFLLLFFEFGFIASKQVLQVFSGFVRQLTSGIPEEVPVPMKMSFDSFLVSCWFVLKSREIREKLIPFDMFQNGKFLPAAARNAMTK
jgi:hypothetical protein